MRSSERQAVLKYLARRAVPRASGSFLALARHVTGCPRLSATPLAQRSNGANRSAPSSSSIVRPR